MDMETGRQLLRVNGLRVPAGPANGATWPRTARYGWVQPTFATVRHRTKVTKDPGPRAAGLALAMAFRLIESAQDRWRAVNAPHLVALVRAGATFSSGKLVERPGDKAQTDTA